MKVVPSTPGRSPPNRSGIPDHSPTRASRRVSGGQGCVRRSIDLCPPGGDRRQQRRDLATQRTARRAPPVQPRTRRAAPEASARRGPPVSGSTRVASDASAAAGSASAVPGSPPENGTLVPSSASPGATGAPAYWSPPAPWGTRAPPGVSATPSPSRSQPSGIPQAWPARAASEGNSKVAEPSTTTIAIHTPPGAPAPLTALPASFSLNVHLPGGRGFLNLYPDLR